MEQVLLNLEEGSRHTFELPAAQAYGERNPDLLQRITRAMLAEHSDPESPLVPGDMVEFSAPNGGRYSGVLKELGRSEEHTSELQSLMRSSYAVFGLKKKNNTNNKRVE